jgi:hypothetical protein
MKYFVSQRLLFSNPITIVKKQKWTRNSSHENRIFENKEFQDLSKYNVDIPNFCVLTFLWKGFGHSF